MASRQQKLDAEVVTIGDELNRGEIVDTNSAFLSERLTALGLHVRWRTSVTDDAPDMTEALRRAAARADVVVCSGGLGPTDDDRTVDVVCALTGRTAVEEPAHAERMRRKFAERNFALTPNNTRQVRIPEGAEVLTNPTGMAPGFTIEDSRLGKARLSFMPGVPREMKPMFEQGLAGPLAARVGDALVTVRRVFRMAGIGESHVDHALKGLLAEGDEHVTLHFRIAFPENLVTLVVRRESEEQARAQLEALSKEVYARLGEHIYGTDADTLPQVIGRLLATRSATLSLAESCTGGLLGSIVTDVPGCSAWFKGGVVAYAYEVKSDVLGVPRSMLVEHGAVSEPVALAMASGVRDCMKTDWSIAITGVAGPDGGTTEKPVGTVWIALHGPDGARTKKLFWPGDREQVRRMSAVSALHLLYKALR